MAITVMDPVDKSLKRQSRKSEVTLRQSLRKPRI